MSDARYFRILKADIHFPSSLDLPANYKDIVRKLCTRDLSARLGNLRGGGNDVKNHPFFSDIDWEELEKKTSLVRYSNYCIWLVTNQIRIRVHLRPNWNIRRM